MAVAVKVDEDLSEDVAEPLRSAGYAATTVYQQGWTGLKDHELWPALQSERYWLLTADKGFGDIRRYPPGSHAGVILLRLEHESRRGYIALVKALTASTRLEELSGSLIVNRHGAFGSVARRAY